MPSPSTVSFANLICRFGEKYVLLDLAKEIVLPAFMDETLRRGFRDGTSYLFLRVRVSQVGAADGGVPLLIVYGKLVKNTTLVSEQHITPEGTLESKRESIPSAPSSFFVSVLNNHKLMFVPEMIQAPSLGAFQATLQKFLSIKYLAYIDRVHDDLAARGERKPKKQLNIEIPHPALEVLPLARSSTA